MHPKKEEAAQWPPHIGLEVFVFLERRNLGIDMHDSQFIISN